MLPIHVLCTVAWTLKTVIKNNALVMLVYHFWVVFEMKVLKVIQFPCIHINYIVLFQGYSFAVIFCCCIANLKVAVPPSYSEETLLERWVGRSPSFHARYTNSFVFQKVACMAEYFQVMCLSYLHVSCRLSASQTRGSLWGGTHNSPFSRVTLEDATKLALSSRNWGLLWYGKAAHLSFCHSSLGWFFFKFS